MPRIIHIVAMDKNGTIGVNDKLPFYIPEDLSNFKAATMDALIVMGFKTYKSIEDNYTKSLENGSKDPDSFLPGRKVTVVCSTKEKALLRAKACVFNNVLFVSKDTYYNLVQQNNKPVIIVGGATLYADSSPPSLIIATIVDTEIVAKENEVLFKYPNFHRLGLNQDTKEKTSYFKIAFKELTSSCNLKYTYNIFLQI